MTNPLHRRPCAGGRPAAAGLALAVAALLAAACGASRTAVRTAPVGSLSDAVECAVQQGEQMGFDVVAVDRSDHRVVLERDDRSVTRSDPTFRRAVGQLTLQPADGTAASGAVEVEAKTFHEFFDRRGRTRRQREPSRRILSAAETLLDRCASGRSALRAPPPAR